MEPIVYVSRMLDDTNFEQPIRCTRVNTKADLVSFDQFFLGDDGAIHLGPCDVKRKLDVSYSVSV